MAYSIYKTNGNLLANIADGTLDTTSTSVSLPGRNFAGYGQPQDTNFVQMVENFANDVPPRNPLKGQLWYNTGNSTLFLCPTDGQTNPSAWSAISSADTTGNSVFGNIQASGNLTSNNLSVTNKLSGNIIDLNYANIAVQANIANLVCGNATIGNLTTTYITTGSAVTPGALIGTWTATGGLGGNAFIVANGNIYTSGIRSGHYYNADGSDFTPTGTYDNTKVFDYLTGANSTVPFIGNVTPGNLTGAALVSASYLTGTLTTGNQPNISNVGTLGNLFVSGNVTAGAFYGSAVGLSAIPAANITGTQPSLTTTSITTGAQGTAGTITGQWTLVGTSRLNATYADLAERFEADSYYDSGTVVELGGSKEITSVVDDLSENIFGVVSKTAAYLMNAAAGDDTSHPPVALSGRLHVKVTGKVKKGDRLVSAGQGKARAALKGEATAFNTIGRSLGDKVDDAIGTVEAIVNVR